MKIFASSNALLPFKTNMWIAEDLPNCNTSHFDHTPRPGQEFCNLCNMYFLFVNLQPVPNIIGPNVHTSGSKNIEICSFDATGTVGHVITDPSDVEFLLLGEYFNFSLFT